MSPGITPGCGVGGGGGVEGMGRYGVIKGATWVPSLSRCHTATDTLTPHPHHPCVSYNISSCLSCPPPPTDVAIDFTFNWKEAVNI